VLGSGVEHGAAAERHDAPAGERVVHDVTLEAAEVRFAVLVEDVGDGTVRGHDDLIGVGEVNLESPRHALADTGLARSHRPDEDGERGGHAVMTPVRRASGIAAR
jgi:hypothetical protein